MLGYRLCIQGPYQRHPVVRAMDGPAMVTMEVARQMLRLIKHHLTDQEIQCLPTYELIEIFLRSQSQKQLFCFAQDQEQPIFSQTISLSQTSVCTKRTPEDVFSYSEPLLQLHFSVTQPDMKFSLQMIEDTRHGQQLHHQMATDKLLSRQLFVNPRGKGSSLYVVANQISLLIGQSILDKPLGSFAGETDEQLRQGAGINSVMGCCYHLLHCTIPPKKFEYYAKQNGVLRVLCQIMLHYREVQQFQSGITRAAHPVDSADPSPDTELYAVQIRMLSDTYNLLHQKKVQLLSIAKRFEELSAEDHLREPSQQAMTVYIKECNEVFFAISQLFQGQNYVQILENELIIHCVNYIGEDKLLINGPKVYQQQLSTVQEVLVACFDILNNDKQTCTLLNDTIQRVRDVSNVASIFCKYQELSTRLQELPQDALFDEIDGQCQQIIAGIHDAFNTGHRLAVLVLDRRDFSVQIDQSVTDPDGILLQSEYTCVMPFHSPASDYQYWKMVICFGNHITSIINTERQLLPSIQLDILDYLAMNIPSNIFECRKFLHTVDMFSVFFNPYEEPDDGNSMEKISNIYRLVYQNLMNCLDEIHHQMNDITSLADEVSFNQVEYCVKQYQYLRNELYGHMEIIELSGNMNNSLIKHVREQYTGACSTLDEQLDGGVRRTVQQRLEILLKMRLGSIQEIGQIALKTHDGVLQSLLAINEYFDAFELFQTFTHMSIADIEDNSDYMLLRHKQQLLNALTYCPTHKLSCDIAINNILEHQSEIMRLYATSTSMDKQNYNKLIGQTTGQLMELNTKLFQKSNMFDAQRLTLQPQQYDRSKHQYFAEIYDAYLKFGEPIAISDFRVVFNVGQKHAPTKKECQTTPTEVFQKLEQYILDIGEKLKQLRGGIVQILRLNKLEVQEYQRFTDHVQSCFNKYAVFQSDMCLIIITLLTSRYCNDLTFIDVRQQGETLFFSPNVLDLDVSLQQFSSICEEAAFLMGKKKQSRLQTQQTMVYSWLSQVLGTTITKFSPIQHSNSPQIKAMKNISLRIVVVALMSLQLKGMRTNCITDKESRYAGTATTQDADTIEDGVAIQNDSCGAFTRFLHQHNIQISQSGAKSIEMIGSNITKLYKFRQAVERRLSGGQDDDVQGLGNQKFIFMQISQLRCELVQCEPQQLQAYLLRTTMRPENITTLQQLFNYQVYGNNIQSQNQQFGMYIFNLDTVINATERERPYMQLCDQLQEYEQEIAEVYRYLIKQTQRTTQRLQFLYDSCFNTSSIEDKIRLCKIQQLFINQYNSKQAVIHFNDVCTSIIQVLVMINGIRNSQIFSLTDFASQYQLFLKLSSKVDEVMYYNNDELFSYVCTQLVNTLRKDDSIEKCMRVVSNVLGGAESLLLPGAKITRAQVAAVNMLLLDQQSQITGNHFTIVDYIRTKILLQSRDEHSPAVLHRMAQAELSRYNYYNTHGLLANVINFFILVEELFVYVGNVGQLSIQQFYEREEQILRLFKIQCGHLLEYCARVDQLKVYQDSIMTYVQNTYRDLFDLLSYMKFLKPDNWAQFIQTGSTDKYRLDELIEANFALNKADIVQRCEKIRSDEEIRHNLAVIRSRFKELIPDNINVDLLGLIKSGLLECDTHGDDLVQDWLNNEIVQFVDAGDQASRDLSYVRGLAKDNLEIVALQSECGSYLAGRLSQLILVRAKQEVINHIAAMASYLNEYSCAIQVEDMYSLANDGNATIQYLMQQRNELIGKIMSQVVPSFDQTDMSIGRSEAHTFITWFCGNILASDALADTICQYRCDIACLTQNILSSESALNRLVFGIDKFIVSESLRIEGELHDGGRFLYWTYYQLAGDAQPPIVMRQNRFLDQLLQVGICQYHNAKYMLLKTVTNLRRMLYCKLPFDTPFQGQAFSDHEVLEFLIPTEDNRVDEKSVVFAARILLDSIIYFTDRDTTAKGIVGMLQQFRSRMKSMANGFICVQVDEECLIVQLLRADDHIRRLLWRLSQVVAMYEQRIGRCNDKTTIAQIRSRIPSFALINQELQLYRQKNPHLEDMLRGTFDIPPTHEAVLQVAGGGASVVNIANVNEAISGMGSQEWEEQFTDILSNKLIEVYISQRLCGRTLDDLRCGLLKRAERVDSKLIYQRQYDSVVPKTMFLDQLSQYKLIERKHFLNQPNRQRLSSRLKFVAIEHAGPLLSRQKVYDTKPPAPSPQLQVEPDLIPHFNKLLLSFVQNNYNGGLGELNNIKLDQLKKDMEESPYSRAYDTCLDKLSTLLDVYQQEIGGKIKGFNSFFTAIMELQLFSFTCIERQAIQKSFVDMLAKVYYFVENKASVQQQVIVQCQPHYCLVVRMLIEMLYVASGNQQHCSTHIAAAIQQNYAYDKALGQLILKLAQPIAVVTEHSPVQGTIHVDGLFSEMQFPQYMQFVQFSLQFFIIENMIKRGIQRQLAQKTTKVLQELVSMVQQIYDDYQQPQIALSVETQDQAKLFIYYCHCELVDIFDGFMSMMEYTNSTTMLSYTSLRQILLFTVIQSYSHFDFQNERFTASGLGDRNIDYPRFIQCKTVLQNNAHLQDKYKTNSWAQYLGQQLASRFGDQITNLNIYCVIPQMAIDDDGTLKIQLRFQNKQSRSISEYPEFLCLLLKMQARMGSVQVSRQFQYTDFQDRIVQIIGRSNARDNISKYLESVLFAKQQKYHQLESIRLNLFTNTETKQEYMMHNVFTIRFYKLGSDGAVCTNQQYDYDEFQINDEIAACSQFQYVDYPLQERTFINKKQYYYNQFTQVFKALIGSDAIRMFHRLFYKPIFNNLLKVDEGLVLKFNSVLFWLALTARDAGSDITLNDLIQIAYCLTNAGVQNYKYCSIMNMIKKLSLIGENIIWIAQSDRSVPEKANTNSNSQSGSFSTSARESQKSITSQSRTQTSIMAVGGMVNHPQYKQVISRRCNAQNGPKVEQRYKAVEVRPDECMQTYQDNIHSRNAQQYWLNSATKTMASLQAGINHCSTLVSEYTVALEHINSDELWELAGDGTDYQANHPVNLRLLGDPGYMGKFMLLRAIEGSPFTTVFVVRQNYTRPISHFLALQNMYFQYRDLVLVQNVDSAAFAETILACMLLTLKYNHPVRALVQARDLSEEVMAMIHDLQVDGFSQTLLRATSKQRLIRFVQLANQLLDRRHIRNVYDILLGHSIVYAGMAVKPAQLVHIYILDQGQHAMIPSPVVTRLNTLAINVDATDKPSLIYQQEVCQAILATLDCQNQIMRHKIPAKALSAELFQRNFTRIMRDVVQHWPEGGQVAFLDSVRSGFERVYRDYVSASDGRRRADVERKARLERQLSQIQAQNDRAARTRQMEDNGEAAVMKRQQIQNREVAIHKAQLQAKQVELEAGELEQRIARLSEKVETRQTPKAQQYQKAVGYLCQKMLGQDYASYWAAIQASQLNVLLSTTVWAILRTSRRRQVQQYVGDASFESYKHKVRSLERLLQELAAFDVNNLIDSEQYAQAERFCARLCQLCGVGAPDGARKLVVGVGGARDHRPPSLCLSELGQRLHDRLGRIAAHPLERYMAYLVAAIIQHAQLRKKMNANVGLLQQCRQEYEARKDLLLQVGVHVRQCEESIAAINAEIEALRAENRRTQTYLDANRGKLDALEHQEAQIQKRLSSVSSRLVQSEFVPAEVLILWYYAMQHHNLFGNGRMFDTCYFEQQFLTHKNDRYFYHPGKIADLLLISLLGSDFVEDVVSRAIQCGYMLSHGETKGQYYQVLNDRTISTSERLDKYYRGSHNVLSEIIHEQLNFIPVRILYLIHHLQTSTCGIVLYGHNRCTVERTGRFLAQFLVFTDGPAKGVPHEVLHAVQSITGLPGVQEQLRESWCAFERAYAEPGTHGNAETSDDGTPDALVPLERYPDCIPLIVEGSARDLGLLDQLLANNYQKLVRDGETQYRYTYDFRQLNLDNYDDKNYKELVTAKPIKLIFLLTGDVAGDTMHRAVSVDDISLMTEQQFDDTQLGIPTCDKYKTIPMEDSSSGCSSAADSSKLTHKSQDTLFNGLKLHADQDITIQTTPEIITLLDRSTKMQIWRDPHDSLDAATQILLDIKREVVGIRVPSE